MLHIEHRSQRWQGEMAATVPRRLTMARHVFVEPARLPQSIPNFMCMQECKENNTSPSMVMILARTISRKGMAATVPQQVMSEWMSSRSRMACTVAAICPRHLYCECACVCITSPHANTNVWTNLSHITLHVSLTQRIIFFAKDCTLCNACAPNTKGPCMSLLKF